MTPASDHPDKVDQEKTDRVLTDGGVQADDDLASEDAPQDQDGKHPKRLQDELLDEGIEETFPASDPVSVKRIT